MKNRTMILALLSVAALAAGCNKPETTSQQLDRVQEKTAEAGQEMKDYTYAQKSEFTEKMQGDLAGINKDLDQLAVKIERASAGARAEAKPRFKALREQADRLGQHLNEAKSATESNWDSAKAASRKAYNDLKDGFKQARQWMSDKIAPEGGVSVNK
jgi:hypothetical protein